MSSDRLSVKFTSVAVVSLPPPPGVLYSLVPLTFTSVKQSLQGVLWILISDAAIVCLSGLVSGVREWKPRLEVFPF